jgi:peptidoglycan-associated lipoprotein
MKKLLRLLSIVIFLVTVSHSDVYGQKKSRKLKKADMAFSLENYSEAAELYKKAYKKEKHKKVKVEIIFKQAECYRMSGNIKRAESYYKRAIKAKYDNIEVYLRYADMLRMQGDLDEAIRQYTTYIQKNPADVRGEMGLKSCSFAKKWKDLPTRYKVELMPVVNSRYSDYSASFGNGEYTEMYFSSSRKDGLSDKIDDRTGEHFSDVWFTRINKKRILE